MNRRGGPGPRIRHRDASPALRNLLAAQASQEDGVLTVRDVVRLAFYLPYDHPDIASGVSHAVERYLREVGPGPEILPQAFIDDDEGDALTEERWEYIRELLLPQRPFRFIDDLGGEAVRLLEKRGYATQLLLGGGLRAPTGYELFYQARVPWRTPSPDSVSILTATLPTEYLESHGPLKVRELALDMASQLRFVSGHVGLALHFSWNVSPADDALRAELARYPGIDLRTAWLRPTLLGTQVDGVHWLNFLGPSVLRPLGGAAGLRARLQSPRTTLRELDAERVVVSLGEDPEAGDLLAGQTLPAYREFARVMEPWLEPFRLTEQTVTLTPPRYSELRFTEDEARRWWRRWFD